jgi:hypothetical protein
MNVMTEGLSSSNLIFPKVVPVGGVVSGIVNMTYIIIFLATLYNQFIVEFLMFIVEVPVVGCSLPIPLFTVSM